VREVMVVVLGDEVHPVDDRHPLTEPRVQAGVLQIVD
jgi:hypothetical protein